MDIGRLLNLQGKTKRGKNVLGRFPKHTVWRVLAVTDQVLFNVAPGPWLFVQPEAVTGQIWHQSTRWLRLKADDDFDVEVI